MTTQEGARRAFRRYIDYRLGRHPRQGRSLQFAYCDSSLHQRDPVQFRVRLEREARRKMEKGHIIEKIDV